MEHKHDIIWYETLDSTNSEAARRADSLDNLSVIAARCQTAGRGQKGNRWISDADLNLTFSIFLRFDTTAAGSGKDFPQIKATDQFMISETATLAQCRLLEAYGIDARIKWPNDIYVGNRKISGMLVENTLEGKWLKTSIVGIGLNVNQVTFPADLPNPVSMRRCSGKKYDTDALLVRFMDFFAENGHYTILRIFLGSQQVVPFGEAAFGQAVASGIVEIFLSNMVLALKLAMPILAAELLGEVGMGILMKAIPQINAFVINIELKVIIGLGLLFFFLTPINEFLLSIEQEMLQELERMLQHLAAGA